MIVIIYLYLSKKKIIITIIIIINVSLFMVDKIEILVKYNYTTRREKCLNTELFLVRIQGNTDHK